ncbi:MAG: FecR family protein, partial [Acidobacteria bacterium]|nr:FecR family protein [Acidobacteriota bacterium]MCA1639728.1 FecR family protein [Acidobacteriota bacterium]
ITVLFSALGFAQDNRTASSVKDLYVISAKAGGVNYVEGQVSVTQRNNRNGLLLKGDTVEVGETVSTGTDGKAEILLNPGSYIRLAENSSFAFSNTSLDDLQLKLNRGTALFEVITDDEFKITVKAPKANFYIVKSGVYRVDVANDGAGKIEVWKGTAQIGNSPVVEVKAGRTATVNGNQVAVSKFDRGDKDALEMWSKSRAKELAKLNSRLQKNDVRNTLMSSFVRRGWNMYDSFGLWVLDPFSRAYCFLPFGYGWSSPYGYGYGRDIWYYRLPQVVYNQPPPPTTVRRAIATIASDDSGRRRGNNSGNNPAVGREVVPPFQRIQRDMGRETIYQDTSPSMSPGRQSAPVVISPPPVHSPSTLGGKGDRDN